MPWPGHGDVIAIEDGEHKHNQDPECMHQHVLFVVSDVKCTMINSEWQCSGGVRRFLPNWQIASSDLAEQPGWLYGVLQTKLVEIAGAP